MKFIERPIKEFKKYIKNNKYNQLLIILLVFSFLLRIIYILKYNAIWWDTAVYIGMGKYIFTLGEIGLWEEFRPLLWPIILGTFWKLKMNPIIIGKILEVIFSLGTIYLVYLMGRRINKNTGIIAATLLSFTQIYFIFTAIPLTDIPALFFSILAIYLFTKDRYFLSGLSLSIAFNLRFPMGLTLGIILIILGLYGLYLKEYIKTIKNSLKLFLGFMVFTLPYLISNYIAYKNVFSPFTFAREVISYSARLDSKTLFFYPINLIINNPLLIFTIVGIVVYLINFKKRNKILDLSFVALIIFTGYFTYEPHRELRYAIGFLPYYCIMASYGIDYLLNKFKKIKAEHIIIIIMLILSLVIIAQILKPDYVTKEKKEFNNFFDKTKENLFVYGGSPIIVVYGNIKFRGITSWEQSLLTFRNINLTERVDYITLNTCELYCSQTDDYCLKKKDEFLNFTNNLKLEFNKTTEGCNLMIFKVI